MTVKELITELEKENPNANVSMEVGDIVKHAITLVVTDQNGNVLLLD